MTDSCDQNSLQHSVLARFLIARTIPFERKARYVVNDSSTPQVAEEAIERGAADAAALGTALIADPDLVERIRRGAAPNEPDPATFYAPGPSGYTDYPTLAA